MVLRVQERSSVLEAHAQAAQTKLKRVRESQTGVKRAEAGRGRIALRVATLGEP